MSPGDWTFSRVTCPDCGHAWTDVHRVGTLLTECPECEHPVPTLCDPDEIEEIEQESRGRDR